MGGGVIYCARYVCCVFGAGCSEVILNGVMCFPLVARILSRYEDAQVLCCGFCCDDALLSSFSNRFLETRCGTRLGVFRSSPSRRRISKGRWERCWSTTSRGGALSTTLRAGSLSSERTAMRASVSRVVGGLPLFCHRNPLPLRPRLHSSNPNMAEYQGGALDSMFSPRFAHACVAREIWQSSVAAAVWKSFFYVCT